MKRVVLIGFVMLGLVHADDITLSDGTVYKNAKIISHTADTATILYEDGGITVPIALLPPDLQTKVANDVHNITDTNARPQTQDQAAKEQRAYLKALDKYVVIDGKLVLRESARVLRYNVKLNHVAVEKDATGNDMGRGSFVDVCTAGGAATTDNPPPNPNTPGLKPCGDSIYLKDYVLIDDKIAQVDVVKVGATADGGVYYDVIQPFTLVFWKQAGSPK